MLRIFSGKNATAYLHHKEMSIIYTPLYTAAIFA